MGLSIATSRSATVGCGQPRVPLSARRHPLVAEVAARLRDAAALDEPIAVGVSGGPDSLALLTALLVLDDRDGPGPRPTAVHVHHHLRGAEADEDAAFVESFCAEHHVPFVRRDVHPGAEPGNTADVARRLRYDALVDAATAIGAPLVAVAHHADDQLETMLMAIARGTGLDGLGAMPVERTLRDGVRLVRPLLAVRAEACRELCRAAGLAWRDDSSNTNPDSRRARLRRDVLPVLHELWPDAARRAAGTARTVAAARAALAQVVTGVFGPAERRDWPRAEIMAHDEAVLAEGLRRALAAADPDAARRLGRKQLLPAVRAIRADERHPRTFHWPLGWRLVVTARSVRLTEPPEHTTRQPKEALHE